jgi:hypothetical protein
VSVTPPSRHDLFLSYATEDFARAQHAHGRATDVDVFFDVPANRPPARIREIAFASLRSVWARLRPRKESAGPPMKSADEIRRLLEDRLDASNALWVLWSRSHRGSEWASHEIAYFQARHPRRPIFVQRLDQTETPADWSFVSDGTDLSKEKIRALTRETQAATDPVSAIPAPADASVGEALRRPQDWVARAARWRAGTNVPELVGLRARRQTDDRERQDALLASARRLVLLVGFLTACLLAAAVAGLLWLRPEPVFARHAILAAATVWTCAAIVGLQASLVAVMPAVLAATAAGLVTQVAVTLLPDYRHGGAAGACAVGTFLGVVVAYEGLLARGRGQALRLSAATWRWAIKYATVAALATLTIGLAVVVLIAPTNGRLHGPLLVPLALLLAVPPFVALWFEVSRWGRLREFFRHGLRPALVLVAVLLLLGLAIWIGSPTVDHGRLYSGFIAGAVAGFCLGCFYVAPGAVLGVQVTSDVRAWASAGGVAFALAALAVAVPLLNPGNDINHEVRVILLCYVGSFAVASLAVGRLRLN